jgi:hypothetical protein
MSDSVGLDDGEAKDVPEPDLGSSTDESLSREGVGISVDTQKQGSPAEQSELRSDAPDGGLALEYEKTLKAVSALMEPAMRRAKLRERLEERPVEEVVWWIDQLLRGSLWGRELEMAAMLACSDWLVRSQLQDDYAFFEALYRCAHELQNDLVLFLLRDPPPHSILPSGARLEPVRLVGRDEVPTGTRRQMAAGNDRRVLRRLIGDPDPLVIVKLLDNPHVQIRDVMSIVTRRPTKPELLAAVVVHPRWFKETLVREALIQNPYIQTGIAAKLLPTVPIHLLRTLTYAGDLHPHLSEAAACFVRLRERRTEPLGV